MMLPRETRRVDFGRVDTHRQADMLTSSIGCMMSTNLQSSSSRLSGRPLKSTCKCTCFASPEGCLVVWFVVVTVIVFLVASFEHQVEIT